MSQVFTFVLALLPIATVFLLLVVLARSAKLSMGVAYLVTAATALLVWGTDLNKILGATVNGAVTAVSLLYIIFGAILMLYTLEESGGIRSIRSGFTSMSGVGCGQISFTAGGVAEELPVEAQAVRAIQPGFLDSSQRTKAQHATTEKSVAIRMERWIRYATA